MFPLTALRRTHAWKGQNYKAWQYMTPTARGQREQKKWLQRVMGVQDY